MTSEQHVVSGVLVVLVLATGTTMAFGASTSDATFNPYNPEWDGGQELRSIATSDPAGAVLLRNASEYPLDDPKETVVFALSPSDPGVDGERRAREFVHAGGTLVVADDGAGSGNQLLAAVEADARVDGATLRDDRHYGPSPGFPVASNVTDHPLTRDVDALTLNYASAIQPGAATPLVRSSELSYLDRNGNESFDADERLGQQPVLTVEAVGDGRVVAVSDSSLFLNSMLERSDNHALARALLDQGTRVVLDTPGDDGVPPAAAAGLAVRRSPLVQVSAATVTLAVVFLVARRPDRPSAWLTRLRLLTADRLDGVGVPAGVRGTSTGGHGDATSSILAGPIEREVQGEQSQPSQPVTTLDTRSRTASAPLQEAQPPDGDRSAVEASPGDVAGTADRVPGGAADGRSGRSTSPDRSGLRRVTEAIITRSEIRDHDD